MRGWWVFVNTVSHESQVYLLIYPTTEVLQLVSWEAWLKDSSSSLRIPAALAGTCWWKICFSPDPGPLGGQGAARKISSSPTSGGPSRTVPTLRAGVVTLLSPWVGSALPHTWNPVREKEPGKFISLKSKESMSPPLKASL